MQRLTLTDEMEEERRLLTPFKRRGPGHISIAVTDHFKPPPVVHCVVRRTVTKNVADDNECFDLQNLLMQLCTNKLNNRFEFAKMMNESLLFWTIARLVQFLVDGSWPAS